MTKHAENGREEIACEVFDDIPPKEKLESMSPLALAQLQEQFSSGKACLVIIQNEWRRREKIEQQKLNQEIVAIQHETSKKLLLEQHDLNKSLSEKQNRTIIYASLIGIVGVVVGVILTTILGKTQVPYSPQISIQTPPSSLLISPQKKTIQTAEGETAAQKQAEGKEHQTSPHQPANSVSGVTSEETK